jgi:CheY-like chemotaxis protein
MSMNDSYNQQVAASPKPTSNSLRVLFVDDEKSLQEFMRTELPRMGHDVTVCPDGKTAL